MLCNQCRFNSRARKLKHLQYMPPSHDSYDDNNGLCYQDSYNDVDGQSTRLLLDVWERNGTTNLDNICKRLFNVDFGNLDFILCFFGCLSNLHLILVFDNSNVFSVIKLIDNNNVFSVIKLIDNIVLIDCQLFFQLNFCPSQLLLLA